MEWRFIDDGDNHGALNMARDEALATCMKEGDAPVLRVYRFSPPAITLGRFQGFPDETEREVFRRLGVDVVRRPTGGRAILHLYDFTYSVTVPRGRERVHEGSECFKLVGKGILHSLEILGVNAEIVKHEKKKRSEAIWCFDSCFGVDIEWCGRKVCGSAQRVMARSILQHGSLFLDIDRELLLGMGDCGAAACGYVATLKEATGRTVEWDDVKEAFLEGFSCGLGINIVPDSLSGGEEEVTLRLLGEKYGGRNRELRHVEPRL